MNAPTNEDRERAQRLLAELPDYSDSLYDEMVTKDRNAAGDRIAQALADERARAEADPDGNLEDYRNAPSGVGPLADEWKDKPHRVLYDLITLASTSYQRGRDEQRQVDVKIARKRKAECKVQYDRFNRPGLTSQKNAWFGSAEQCGIIESRILATDVKSIDPTLEAAPRGLELLEH